MMMVRKEEVTPFDFGGLGILDYTAKCEEKSSFAVISVPAHCSHPLSWSNRSDKYYYIINGAIDFTINNEHYTLNQGDFCLIKKGDTFKYANSTQIAASLILVHSPNFVFGEEKFE
jgi:mannose-6-phosphate isomerase-like protein (cupin superfamily)